MKKTPHFISAVVLKEANQKPAIAVDEGVIAANAITIEDLQLEKKEMKLKMGVTKAVATMKRCYCSNSLFIKRLSKAEESH